MPLILEEVKPGWIKVSYENGVYLGDLTREHDLCFNFWPEHPSKGGFWAAYVLKELADKLEQLNTPILEEYDKWCEEHESKGLPDVSFD